MTGGRGRECNVGGGGSGLLREAYGGNGKSPGRRAPPREGLGMVVLYLCTVSARSSVGRGALTQGGQDEVVEVWGEATEWWSCSGSWNKRRAM